MMCISSERKKVNMAYRIQQSKYTIQIQSTICEMLEIGLFTCVCRVIIQDLRRLWPIFVILDDHASKTKSSQRNSISLK